MPACRPGLLQAALVGAVIAAMLFAAERQRGAAAPDKTNAYPYHVFVPLAGGDGPMPIVLLRLNATIALQQAEGRWNASGIRDYRLVALYGSFGLTERRTIVVREGVVVSSTTVCLQPVPPPDDCPFLPDVVFTVPGMFEQLWAWVRHLPTVQEPGKPTLHAEYDLSLGFPLSFLVRTVAVPDSGWGITVESLEILAAK